MKTWDLIKLTALAKRTNGRAEIAVGLIDGPVTITHPGLMTENIREVPGRLPGVCSRASSIACMHGTKVAGILSGRRTSQVAGICPGCTLLVRPIFSETSAQKNNMPNTTPAQLAEAIVDTVKAGAKIINMSMGLEKTSLSRQRVIEEALNYAARRGVIVVAAAGNQGMLTSSTVTRYPWVIPVVAYNYQGRPMQLSNLSQSIGRLGLGASGDDMVSLNAAGGLSIFSGTSAATPFVTGAIALLWSEFPSASAVEIKNALLGAVNAARHSVVPPLLNAEAAYQQLKQTIRRN